MENAQTQEIEEARAQSFSTRRATVPALEEVLFSPFEALDHGFVRVIDYMGDDAAIVQAARVSYGKGTKKISEDRALIRYLLRNAHTTPFEMPSIKLHVKLPIFVARQWIRHRTASVNEYSARYSILDKEFYIPEPAQLASQSTNNRQGRGTLLSPEEAAEVLRILRTDAETTYDHYLYMLNEDESGNRIAEDRTGLARELARMNLTLNTYTQWYWKTDLHNLMNFLRLRAHPHAQFEIRVYAEIMLSLLKRWVPLTFEAFSDYKLNSYTLSHSAILLMTSLLKGLPTKEITSTMSARELDELKKIFDINDKALGK